MAGHQSQERQTPLDVVMRIWHAWGPFQLEPLGNSGGFSGARIWRASCASGKFALRRWPRPGLPARRILGLHALLRHLESAGFQQVAVPVFAQGTSLHHDQGADWQLEPWLPGRADFHQAPTRIRLEHIIRSLAQWHTLAATFRSSVEAAEWFGARPDGPSPGLRERLAAIVRLDEQVLGLANSYLRKIPDEPLRNCCQRVLCAIRAGRTRVQRELQRVSDRCVRLQPCLRDVWHDHILLDGPSVMGIIDPSACRVDTVATDLARLLRSLVGHRTEDWQFALDVYEQHGRLNAAERSLVPAFDHSGVLLSGWTWLQWLLFDGRRFEDLQAVLVRLTDIECALASQDWQ